MKSRWLFKTNKTAKSLENYSYHFRKDLVSFTSWLSQTPPFTAKNKRPAAKMKFDLQLITEVNRLLLRTTFPLIFLASLINLIIFQYIRQTTIARNGNVAEGNELMVDTFQNYSFDKVCFLPRFLKLTFVLYKCFI